jgi:hypothetical protein
VAKLTAAQVAKYAHTAGFGLAGGVMELATAIAVAFAEHRGQPNPTAIGHNSDGTIDVGVWQINSRNFEYVGTDEAHLLDPQANAIAANSIYGRAGNKFTDWVTFNQKIYLAYMPGALAAAKAELRVKRDTLGTGDIPGSASSPNGLDKGVDATTGAVTSIVTAPVSVAKFLGKLSTVNTWVRVLEIVFGGIFVLSGLALLAKELGATDAATSIVGAVPGPVGAAVKTTVGKAGSLAKEAAKNAKS